MCTQHLVGNLRLCLQEEEKRPDGVQAHGTTVCVCLQGKVGSGSPRGGEHRPSSIRLNRIAVSLQRPLALRPRDLLFSGTVGAELAEAMCISSGHVCAHLPSSSCILRFLGEQ